MRTSGLFGGGYLSSYYDDGAVVTLSSTTSTGVLLDVQERGLASFSLQNSTDCQLTITIDGRSFSGFVNEIWNSIGTNISASGNTFYIQNVAYNSSLKVEVTANPSSNGVSVSRLS